MERKKADNIVILKILSTGIIVPDNLPSKPEINLVHTREYGASTVRSLQKWSR